MNLVTLESGDKDVLVDVIHFCFEVQVEQKVLVFFSIRISLFCFFSQLF